jgi:hypothetical protein
MTGEFGERLVMVCQICKGNHHDSNKEVFVKDPATGAWKKAMCAICCCLDCVQLADDPIRMQLRPLMMGQTLESTYNLTVDEHHPGQAPTRRRITSKAPGPLDMKKTIQGMQGLLGLQPSAAPPVHKLPQTVSCDCGKNAASRCIACDVPLCMMCLKAHECG